MGAAPHVAQLVEDRLILHGTVLWSDWDEEEIKRAQAGVVQMVEMLG